MYIGQEYNKKPTQAMTTVLCAESAIGKALNSTAENDRVFSAPTADISSEDSSASHTQRQKRCGNAVFRVVKDGNRDCSCSPTGRDWIAVLLFFFDWRLCVL